jgi:hypothetical protein
MSTIVAFFEEIQVGVNLTASPTRSSQMVVNLLIPLLGRLFQSIELAIQQANFVLMTWYSKSRGLFHVDPFHEFAIEKSYYHIYVI